MIIIGDGGFGGGSFWFGQGVGGKAGSGIGIYPWGTVWISLLALHRIHWSGRFPITDRLRADTAHILYHFIAYIYKTKATDLVC
jgi:hypothetical protein